MYQKSELSYTSLIKFKWLALSKRSLKTRPIIFIACFSFVKPRRMGYQSFRA